MQNENVKEQLMQAAIKLLTNSKDPCKITARQIAAEASANLAMINYYYSSKDGLINEAVNSIIETRAGSLKDISAKNIPGKQKLYEFLVTMSDILLEYADIARASIPYLLLEGDIVLPYYILPLIKECYHNKRSEEECRLLAYQLISFLQLVFYRMNDFMKFSGIDIEHKQQRDQMLQSYIDFYFRE